MSGGLGVDGRAWARARACGARGGRAGAEVLGILGRAPAGRSAHARAPAGQRARELRRRRARAHAPYYLAPFRASLSKDSKLKSIRLEEPSKSSLT